MNGRSVGIFARLGRVVRVFDGDYMNVEDMVIIVDNCI